RIEELGACDGRQSDGPCPHDGYYVTGLDLSVEDADFVRGGEDVGQHQDLLVTDAVRYRVGGEVGERYTHLLGLRAVDLVAEDPTAASKALAGVTLAAVAAGAARADARHQHAVAHLHAAYSCPDLRDGADTL